MRVVIFGSRNLKDAAIMDRAIANAASKGIVPTVVICGMAPGGDSLGREWAERHGVPWEPFPADWNDLSVPGAVVRYRNGKPYNARAGHTRNLQMGESADAGICVWDGASPGTKDMIAILRNLRKPVHVELLGESQPGLFDNV